MPSTKPVTAAGGAVYKQNGGQSEVLLIFRRGVWDLPKGKLEDGETIRQCAIREVAEEVGSSTLPEVTHTLVDTYHEYDQEGIHYGKTTHWFAMEFGSNAGHDFDPQTDEGIKDVQWIPLPEAKSRVGYQNLVRVLTSLEEFLHSRLS